MPCKPRCSWPPTPTREHGRTRTARRLSVGVNYGGYVPRRIYGGTPAVSEHRCHSATDSSASPTWLLLLLRPTLSLYTEFRKMTRRIFTSALVGIGYRMFSLCLFVYLSVCLSVCLLAGKLKNCRRNVIKFLDRLEPPV